MCYARPVGTDLFVGFGFLRFPPHFDPTHLSFIITFIRPSDKTKQQTSITLF